MAFLSSRKATDPARRLAAKPIWSLLVGAGLVVTAVGATMWLTQPGWGGWRSSAAVRTAPRASGAALASPGSAPAPQVPLYSEDWVNDSGNAYAAQFNLLVEDARSLEEIRRSLDGRGERGIARKLEELAGVDRGTAAGRMRALQLNIILALLHLSIGECAEAERRCALALESEPDCPRLLRANIVALRGVAAMRRGETENCIACCNGSSCIFPLAPAAVHLRPSGSREAIRLFTAYLQERPEDLGVQWLLNVAHMTLGTYPDAVPKEHLIPLEPFRSVGNVGRLTNIAGPAGLNVRAENMSGGAIVDDFTGDGLFDVFTSSLDATQGSSLFVNRGDGTFEDRSARAGLDPQFGALNCNHADYDNDGDLDVLLLRGGWEYPMRLSLLRNDGLGGFTDVTAAAGLDEPIASETAGWADYDLDGDLDLYVAGEFTPKNRDPRSRGRLYRNNGDGTFTDVAESAGVLNNRYGKGVAWGDYDNDGRPDLYVSNMAAPGAGRTWMANRLYHNHGDGTFTDVAEALGVTEPNDSFSCWFWDYDNDGWLDLFVTGFGATQPQVIKSHLGQPTGGERPRLYHNERGRFRDVTLEAGLDRVWLPMGSNFGDVDNDGFLDFYLGTGWTSISSLVPNVLMHNIGGRKFEDVTTSSGTGHLQKGHGISFADWDRDGDLDIYLEAGGSVPGDRAHNVLFENPGLGHRWLALKLIGTRSNRAAIGARVRLDLAGPEGPRAVHRLIAGGSSFGNNPLTPTIGLGRAESIVALEIAWPDGGTRQVVRDVPLDRAITVTEGTAGFRLLDWKPIPRSGR
jgi:hypothetical protein